MEFVKDEALLSILEEPEVTPPIEVFQGLLEEAGALFREEPQLLEVGAEEVLVVGDTHGDLLSSVQARKRSGDLATGAVLFLGDYVDRGPQQVENLAFVLAWKLVEPDAVFLLRGNHESPITNSRYGFLSELSSKYGREIYSKAASAFSQMPYAAILTGASFAVHGGLAKGVERVDEVVSVPKGDVEPRDPVAFQLLWNDPDEGVDWFVPNVRGPGTFRFGRRALEHFLEVNGLEKVIRGHEFFTEGLTEMFDGKLKSVFSSRYYGGRSASLLLGETEQKAISLE